MSWAFAGNTGPLAFCFYYTVSRVIWNAPIRKTYLSSNCLQDIMPLQRCMAEMSISQGWSGTAFNVWLCAARRRGSTNPPLIFPEVEWMLHLTARHSPRIVVSLCWTAHCPRLHSSSSIFIPFLFSLFFHQKTEHIILHFFCAPFSGCYDEMIRLRWTLLSRIRQFGPTGFLWFLVFQQWNIIS